jgi:DNA-binding CsgD family transcriptional regulator
MKTLTGHMHWLTVLLIIMEFALFVTQLFYFLARSEDKAHLWYAILLALLILFNISNGLLADPSLTVNSKALNMAAIGIAYLAGAYMPYYFYKTYKLEKLRFYATWGAILFLLFPYIIFDFVYAVNGKLAPDREWSTIVPGIYGIIVLSIMLRSIRHKFKQTRNRRHYRCQLMVLIAVIPWELMSLLAFFPIAQWLEILLGNLGWLAITVLQLGRAALFFRDEHQKYRELTFKITPEELAAGCTRYHLSLRETDVAGLWIKSLDRQAIANTLFISKHTVKTHLVNIYEKTGASSREDLIRKLKDGKLRIIE